MKFFNPLLTALFVLSLTQINAQCGATGSRYVASYPAGWNYFDLGDGAASTSSSCGDNKNGSFWSGGNAVFFSTRSGRELRLSSSIPAVSNLSWTMDFTLQITTNGGVLASNSPAAVLASLTADPQSLVTSCSGGNFCSPCGSYPQTNMDAIWVELVSDAPSSCNESQTGKNWRIVAHARDGNGTPTTSSSISIPSGGTGTYYIRLQRSADRSGMVGVYTTANHQTHVSGSPQCLDIPLNVNGLDALNHEVIAQESCQRVFNGVVKDLKIDNGVTCPLALSPSFTMPTSICGVQPFIVNGSTNTSGTSIGISGHLWVVEECNANGNQFGPVWYGPGMNGAPSGNYTINPALFSQSVHMQVGHYYKISLVVQNCGNPWAAASHVLYVKPVPVISMAGSSTAALPNSTLNLQPTVTGGTAPYTFVVCLGGFNQGYLQPFTVPYVVHPSQNSSTTYYITATNAEGCSTNKSWYISGPYGEPPVLSAAFTVNAIPLNADEFTLEIYPDDLDGYSHEDFTYTHVIEELAQDGTSLYSHTSSDCWTNYPDFENLKGFVSTTTGSYDQTEAPNCGDPGIFRFGATYRVTTLMNARDMEEEQYSVLIYQEKSGQLVIKEDKNAPDMRHTQTTASDQLATNIIISPNPSTGIFMIELEEGMDGSLIEVTNALGQKVKSFEQAGLRSELNMTGFKKGIYIVTITSNGSVSTKKIILE